MDGSISVDIGIFILKKKKKEKNIYKYILKFKRDLLVILAQDNYQTNHYA